jgi:hypothetical protein
MSRFVLVSCLLLGGCGGGSRGSRPMSETGESSEEDLGVRMTADDMVSRSILTKADLTTEVDPKRYRAIAQISSEFSAAEPVIYMVGRLKNIPADSTIEVRWFIDASPEPLLISRVQGSENFQFIASFKPAGNKFQRGLYTARVYVRGSEIGAQTFSIYDKDIESKGVRVSRVEVSTNINKKQKALQPGVYFERGAQKLFVSFYVEGVDLGVVAEVHWMRGSETFHSEDVTLTGDKCYSAHIQSNDGLPDGEYTVQILVYDNIEATKNFVIGKKSQGPSIDEVALGLQLKADNMPAKSQTVFKRNDPVIQCGLRFLDLPAGSIIEIQWMEVDEDGETLRYTNRSTLSSGGSGTMGAAWELKYELDAGNYNAVVLVNGEIMAEQAFEIE